MTTATESTDTQTELPNAAQLDPGEDILQRHLKRTLRCKLSREELTDIALDAAKKRRRARELESDLAAEKKRRQQQIDELQGEIDTADRELDTREQERVVLCNLIFRAGKVFVRRTDAKQYWTAGGRDFEMRPATPQEAQRFLPAVESTLQPNGKGPLLDQAAAAQGKASAPAEPEDSAADTALSKPPEDDGLSEPETSAQKSARESEQARAKRRGGGGKNGRAKP